VDFTTESDGAATTGTTTTLEATGVIGIPLGGVPVTVAVFTKEPASRSACVTVCEAVQVVETPGAKVVTGQLTAVVRGSETAMLVMVTLPVLVTTNEYGTMVPTALTDTVAVDFTTDNAGPCIAGTVTVLEFTGAIGAPIGGVPTTEAVLITEPASRSAWVTVWLAEQRVEAPGASDATGQLMPVAVASEMLSALIVTFPVLVTVNE
jgi:hypothetical protein